ncbi:LuxR C-terminal-related transcriptional regulator [Pseudonocardia adelaidensis]|uniref:LuxR C-terminal-related transcriptional regulator n=1 Tax=Pseudonocardia adelaidensis TaxID=648754 RepID=A0ABP9NHJ2_9PSEU
MPQPKIQLPRVSTTVLDRARLLAAVGGGGDPNEPGEPGVVVEVCAPAGYGKTTLLAAYARALRDGGHPVGWVTCDRHDADPVLLWNAILAALSGAAPHPATAQDPFAALEPPRTMDPAFLAEFVEAIDADGTPITLVLDDVHELTDARTLSGLSDLLRNLPDQLRLMIGSRRDPGIPLHRLQLEDRLRQIRADELAFTRAETGAVLSAQGVDLGEDDLTLLWQRTEGWPAAVRLASLALAEEGEPSRFVANFAGDDRAVAVYLVAEILDRQPEDVQQFLLDTCVAEDLTADLAAVLSRREDAGALLERLEQANALVHRLGRVGQWYRYHALLRTYLLGELRRRGQAAARARHRQAAEWYAEAGQAEPALEHAVAAGEDTMVRVLLSRYGLRLLLSGGGRRLRGTLAGCSPEVLDTPEVGLLVATAALEAGDLVGGEEMLARVPAVVHTRGSHRVRRLRDVALLYRARLRADPTVLDTVLGTMIDDVFDTDPPPAVEAAGPDDAELELLLLANRGTVRIPAGDYERAHADLLAALELSRRHGYDHLTLDCLNQLAGAATGRCMVDESRRWAEEAIAFAAERGWASSPRLAYSHLIAAWCAHLMLDMEEATRRASVSVAVLQSGATVEPEVEGAARSGEAVIAFDRYPQRHEALQRMRWLWHHIPDSNPSPALIAYAELAELRMSLALGERGQAVAVVARVDELLPETGETNVLRALVALDRHRHEQVRAAIAPVLSGERPVTVVTTEMTAWLVEALATAHAEMPEAAHRAVLRALEIGVHNRVMRPFYDLGEPVRELLTATVGRAGWLEPFLSDLLGAWTAAQEWQDASVGGTAVAGESGHRSVALAVPLTAREMELLRDLPSMLTAEEIAVRHTVSVNTVKTHLRSLYRKLGAPNRREAVAAGRRLCLL